MSFGAKFVGNAGQVIIDQDHPCLHLVASGTYPATNAQIINVSYPSPVQSPLPPFVFFCPNGSHHITMFQHAGSAGNWTGFSFYVKVFQDTSGVVLGGKWKACAVFMPKTGGWGMQIFDNQSRVVFDSNRDLVRFISGTQLLNITARMAIILGITPCIHGLHRGRMGMMGIFWLVISMYRRNRPKVILESAPLGLLLRPETQS
ncbi:hypothetical protein NDR77_24550 [Pseudomonas aeruginosa]|nr:hypothetical protein [Pseudomonas aeruginosa]